jgi:hypothetical protein
MSLSLDEKEVSDCGALSKMGVILAPTTPQPYKMMLELQKLTFSLRGQMFIPDIPNAS